eukprot:CAMPEP_0114251546 /NCGR_PEP_ID=MMETSP0058-20121206/15329_1 /TAXON_ID=36894 /ORGANISM="Pyramimonas parkeae, CCMP726" /LENGTH=623 /DNA_ID=CAMNT_0001365357 /DNA_START=658 /DNA_END=2526 /DNA_ORIENTATION=-
MIFITGRVGTLQRRKTRARRVGISIVISATAVAGFLALTQAKMDIPGFGTTNPGRRLLWHSPSHHLVSTVSNAHAHASADAGLLPAASAGALGEPRRSLLSSGCSCPRILDWHRQGGVALFFVGVCYLFLGLALVCDDFFVPSLEKISLALDLSDDVAGATFMAAGSSAPELFASLTSLINPDADDSIGIATIVGSAIFNVLVIIGVTGAAAGQVLSLDWKPLARDGIFYALSVLLMLFCIDDGEVNTAEGVVLVAGYLVYVSFMVVNARVFQWLDAVFPGLAKTHPPAPTEHFNHGSNQAHEDEPREHSDQNFQDGGHHDTQLPPSPGPAPVPQSGGREGAELAVEMGPLASPGQTGLVTPIAAKFQNTVRTSIMVHRFIKNTQKRQLARAAALDEWELKKVHMSENPMYRNVSGRTDTSEPNSSVLPPTAMESSIVADQHGECTTPDDTEEEDNNSPFVYPTDEDTTTKIVWVLSLPFYALFTLTIPDCQNKRFEQWYVLSFVNSILWIGVITWFMVDWANFIGCVLEVPAVAMGVTVLAAGTSLPDALGSVAVAKQGQGDMAVSNAIGSNIFDILFGLGLPWLITTLAQDKKIEVAKDDLFVNVLFLYGVLVVYVGLIVW